MAKYLCLRSGWQEGKSQAKHPGTGEPLVDKDKNPIMRAETIRPGDEFWSQYDLLAMFPPRVTRNGVTLTRFKLIEEGDPPKGVGYGVPTNREPGVSPDSPYMIRQRGGSQQHTVTALDEQRQIAKDAGLIGDGIAPAKQEEVQDTEDGLGGLEVKELRAIAEAEEIELKSSMLKADIVRTIRTARVLAANASEGGGEENAGGVS